jgi:REP-associated tyrosine transposase
MGNIDSTGDAVWDVRYHLIWITKYRYEILCAEVAEQAREVVRQVCQSREVSIIRGAISPDHVRMMVAAPPQLAPAKLVQYIKGRSSRRLQEGFPHLRNRYWGQHLWARGYFCTTVDAVDEKTIIECAESQKWGQDDQGFKIAGNSSGGLSRKCDFQSPKSLSA